MGKDAAPAAKGGITKTSEVDFDRLWRARVDQELANQRQWKQEYGFMLEGNFFRSQRTADNAATTDPSEASLSYVGCMSTQRASYSVRPSPELPRDTHPFNRKKYAM